MLHIPPTNLVLLSAEQELYKKTYLLTKVTEEFSGGKKSGEWASRHTHTQNNNNKIQTNKQTTKSKKRSEKKNNITGQ